ncbi:MAG: tetratricopeptide repeat protein [Acidobacteria bacterium]|nr:tetratricopeptide repeat protein [Acidobacteriota bacterium]
MRAFRVGAYQIYCQPSRLFTVKDTLAVAFQVNNLPAEAAAGGEIRVEFLKDGQPFREIRRKPSEYPDLPTCLEEVPLSGFPPAHYTVRVSARSAAAEIVSATEEFDLSYSESVPRPWFSSRVLPDTGDPGYAGIMGSQLFNLGRFDEALSVLEPVFAQRPDSEDSAYALARVYLALENAPAVARTLTPFVDPSKTAKYETYILAAEALKRAGEPDRAIHLGEQALAHYGVNSVLLNMMGDCFAELGKTREALAVLEKSLELSPDQPGVRLKIEELKKRK